MLEDVRTAARNNAEWCDIVCGSHGPLVGYETTADLAPALSAGFTTTGPLRVWLHA